MGQNRTIIKLEGQKMELNLVVVVMIIIIITTTTREMLTSCEKFINYFHFYIFNKCFKDTD